MKVIRADTGSYPVQRLNATEEVVGQQRLNRPVFKFEFIRFLVKMAEPTVVIHRLRKIRKISFKNQPTCIECKRGERDTNYN